MIVVHALCRSKPERRAETVAAMLEVQRASLEHDAGCLHYRFVADLEDDCQFTCVEEWEDADSLRAHLDAPHLDVYRAAVADTLEGPSELRVFEARTREVP